MRISRPFLTGLCGLVLAGAVAFLAGCGGDDNNNTVTPPPPPPPATTGTISGTASLPPGLPGDLGNARVGIFSSLDNWNNDIPSKPFGRVNGSGPSVTFLETNITPGSYFVEIWQDTNRNAAFDAGDWWGISGTSAWPNPAPAFVMVAAGQTSVVQIFLIAIP